MKRKSKTRLVPLDSDFETIGAATLRSGNVRVIFRNGASADIYTSDVDDEVFITINGSTHRLVLHGTTECDFVVRAEKI